MAVGATTWKWPSRRRPGGNASTGARPPARPSARVVTPTGTRDVELIYHDDGTIVGEIYFTAG